jgi:hypothetical protein
MAQASQLDDTATFVEAYLTYSIDTGVKPVTGTTGPGGRLRARTGTFDRRPVRIADGRPVNDRLSIEREGFRLVRHDTRMVDFYDADELRAVYYPEIEQLVKDELGAARVEIFDHTLRSGDEGARAARQLREPVQVVHNDYTEWSGPQRVRDLPPAAEAADLLSRRVAVVQVWRPIDRPVEADPLAICDARSLAPEDLIPAERRHPDRVGEIYHIAYNPDHRWFYFPRMARDEAIVFKCYDSVTDGRARFTAHGSFTDPGAPADAPPRESIEMRTLVYF